MDQDQILRIGIFALIGVGLAARGIYDRVIKGDEKFDPVHSTTTVLAHATAGGILALQQDEFDEATFYPIAVAVTDVFDRKINPYIEAFVNNVLGREGENSLEQRQRQPRE